MKSLKEFNIQERFQQVQKKVTAPHTKAALVDEIVRVVGVTPVYNYVFWLAKIKQFEKKGGKVGDILDWLKEIKDYPTDFNKGGILTNKIKNYGRKPIHEDATVAGTICCKKEEQRMEASVV